MSAPPTARLPRVDQLSPRQRGTDRACPKCGHVDGENRDGEKFQCTSCQHIDHADRVRPWNVALRAGLVLPDVA